MSDLAVTTAGSSAGRIDPSASRPTLVASAAPTQPRVEAPVAPAPGLVNVVSGPALTGLQAPARRANERELVAARSRPSAAPAIRDVEVRQSFNGGICGVYNEAERRVEWRSETAAGVAGVYDPQTRSVRWYTQANQAIAAVRNPETGDIQVARNPDGGIAGVFDPNSRQAYFERGNRNEGIAMVVDPATDEVETYRTPRRPVVGYIDPRTGGPNFEAGQMDGIAVVYRQGSTYRSSCAYVPGLITPRPDPMPPQQPPIPPLPRFAGR